jgi:polysaccharide export outer membrane protein
MRSQKCMQGTEGSKRQAIMHSDEFCQAAQRSRKARTGLREAKLMIRNQLHLGTPSVMRFVRICFLMTLSIFAISSASGQQTTVSKASEAATATSSSPEIISARSDDRYRIGPGDVVDIRVFNKPQFSRDSVRVDSHGMIRMPLIQEEIKAACHTEEELAKEIATRYLEYLRNPQVDVFIRDYQSEPVAVLGAVRTPSRFQLQRRVRLLELLSHVGGPTENAGVSIQIVHTATASMCEPSGQNESGESDASVLDNYKLSDTLKGEDKANPYVRPGDVITVIEAEQAFVVGNVLRPSAIPLREKITVSRAIAMSGGTMPDTRSEQVRIVRQSPGSTAKTEIFVDLKAIDKQRAEDIALQPGDIVDVPASGGKRLLRSLLAAVVPTVAQLPTRVIPIP